MTNRKINIRERTISELICEYAYAVHTDQPALFTYFNPEEVHILGSFLNDWMISLVGLGRSS